MGSSPNYYLLILLSSCSIIFFGLFSVLTPGSIYDFNIIPYFAAVVFFFFFFFDNLIFRVIPLRLPLDSVF